MVQRKLGQDIVNVAILTNFHLPNTTPFFSLKKLKTTPLLRSRGEGKLRKHRRSGNFGHLDLKTVSEAGRQAGRSTSRSAVKQGTSVQEHEHTTLPARPRCYESERDLKAREEGNGREDPAARGRGG
jgi:hypothetical protein